MPAKYKSEIHAKRDGSQKEEGNIPREHSSEDRFLGVFFTLFLVIGMNGKLAAGGLEAAVDESLESIKPNTCGWVPLLSVVL